jgi:hypothetical protein
LLLLDFDVPEALDALLLLLLGCGFDLGYAEGEEGHGQQFECVFGAGAIGNGR